MDDLTACMKRLRTEEDPEEKKEAASTSTALVVARPQPPTRNYYFSRRASPEYPLPPPLGTFPVVLYKGPPSPTVKPARRLESPSHDDLSEISLLSRENRTLRVSPSMTIELVEDDDDEDPSPVASPRPMVDAPGPSMDEND